MTWLVWRQYRAQAAIASVLLAALAAVVLADGFAIASRWHSVLVACAGNGGCLEQAPTLVNGLMSDLPYFTLVVPVVLGMLWGAPLVASELEARTSDFAWTQSVTRTRWLAVKAGWLLLAAVAWGGAVSALFTWWSGPINAESATAFTPGQFDTQGIVPIGYAVFAMALGIAVGTVARRTLPAIAVVLGGFIALRLVIANLLRPHYMAAVTNYFSVTGTFTPAGAGLGARPGRRQPERAGRGEGLGRPGTRASRRLPAAAARGPTAKSGASMNSVFSCMQAHGWRGFVTYQPASRYWPFQGIETGIYVLLAAALIAVTFVVVRRRDA